MSKKLTEKQKLFCKYYLINLNATDAAVKAGYSKKSAKTNGNRMLTNDNFLHVQDEIQENLAKRANEADITALAVLNNLKKAITIALGEKGRGRGEART